MRKHVFGKGKDRRLNHALGSCHIILFVGLFVSEKYLDASDGRYPKTRRSSGPFLSVSLLETFVNEPRPDLPHSNNRGSKSTPLYTNNWPISASLNLTKSPILSAVTHWHAATFLSTGLAESTRNGVHWRNMKGDLKASTKFLAPVIDGLATIMKRRDVKRPVNKRQ